MNSANENDVLHNVSPLLPPGSHYTMIYVLAVADLEGKVEQCTPYTVVFGDLRGSENVVCVIAPQNLHI